jgi:hypothetical protein
MIASRALASTNSTMLAVVGDIALAAVMEPEAIAIMAVGPWIVLPVIT